MMLATIRMSTWQDGKMISAPRVLELHAVREALLLVTDNDEAQIERILSTVEETGACYLIDDEDDDQFVLERVLHS